MYELIHFKYVCIFQMMILHVIYDLASVGGTRTTFVFQSSDVTSVWNKWIAIFQLGLKASNEWVI